MSTLNNIKIGTKLTASFLFIAFLLIGVSLLGFYILNTNRSISTAYSERLLMVEELGVVNEYFQKMRADTYKFVLSETKDEHIEADIQEDINEVNKALDNYGSYKIIMPEESAKLEELRKSWVDYQNAVREVLEGEKAGQHSHTDVVEDHSPSGTAENEFLNIVDQLVDLGLDAANELNVESAALFSISQVILLAASVFAVLVAIGLGIALSNNILRPLQKGVAMLQELSVGHLDRRLNMRRKDETGDMARAMDAFAEDLQNNVVSTLRKIADGDLSTDIIPKDEHDEISPALMQITTSLRGLVDEVGMLTRAGVEGKLSTRGNTAKFKGSYREIVLGINSTLDAVINPLSVAAIYVDSVANGIVPKPIVENYNGDFDTLKNNLNRMGSRLREMLSTINDITNNLSSAAAEILAATTQQASGASEQSAAISQTTTTVEEVKTSSEQASMRAQDVASASQRTVQVARSGQSSVQATIDSMSAIKEKVEGISENLLVLSDQTQQIGEIISTVNEIASQSNMLALNASVEAARAGEHGKGFAVVATEVRSLAEQSRQATEQIKAILSEIQKATNSTVMATEEGVKGVDRGMQLSAQSRQSIEQLAAVIDESAQMAAQVVASGRQQQTGIDQIALAMQNINQVTMQGLASTRQTEKSAQSLNDLARKMSDILAQYKF